MVQWEELLTPRGRLHAAALWPSKTGGYDADGVRSKLQEFIKAGLVEVAGIAEELKDRAVAAYCYWRAFDEKYQERVLVASSSTLADGASATHTAEQLAELKSLRDEAWAEYIGLVVVMIDDPPDTRSSASVETHYSW